MSRNLTRSLQRIYGMLAQGRLSLMIVSFVYTERGIKTYPSNQDVPEDLRAGWICPYLPQFLHPLSAVFR